MKRIYVIIGLILFIFLIASCGANEPEAREEITIEYKAQTGGYVKGTTTQRARVVPGEDFTFEKVSARPYEGYRFVGWSDGKKDAERQDTVCQSITLTAEFEKINYATVTYIAEAGGIIQGEFFQTLELGQSTSAVRAVAKEGYAFTGWSDGVKTEERTDTIDGDKEIRALFSRLVLVEYKATEGGYIIGNANQRLLDGASGTTVMAASEKGYRFMGWDDDVKKSSRSDTPTESHTYTAIFKRYYNISFTCDASKGTITGRTEQEVIEGEMSYKVTVKANDGYSFLCWSNGEASPTISVEATQSETIEAYFTYESAGLPVISIDTDGGRDITSKDYYLDCIVTVLDSENGFNIKDATGQIKGRGNSTWNAPKKPYKIKFEEKQNLFGFGKSKDWVLLTNYIDKSLLRNYLAYQIGLGFEYLGESPNCIPVEVYLNGSYNGVYLLCEQVEVNKHRVEVDEDTTYPESSSYLVEMDGWADGTCASVPDHLNNNRKYSIKFPDEEELTNVHVQYIEAYLKGALAAASGDDYEQVKKFIDVDSFAQGYIVVELLKCPDVDYSSVYMHKEANGLLYYGPLWDFDMALGNVNHKGGDAQRYDYLFAKNKNPWFNKLLQHEEFKALVGKYLLEYEEAIRQIINDCFDYAYSKEDAFKKNFEKWDILDIYVWPNPQYIVDLKTWEAQVEYARDYLNKSLDFLLKTYG